MESKPNTWSIALDFLLNKVSKTSHAPMIHLALQGTGIIDLAGFLIITDEKLKKLSFFEELLRKRLKLKLGPRKCIQLFNWFLVFIQEELYHELTLDDILAIKKEDYKNFCFIKAFYYIFTFSLIKRESKRTLEEKKLTPQVESQIFQVLKKSQ